MKSYIKPRCSFRSVLFAGGAMMGLMVGSGGVAAQVASPTPSDPTVVPPQPASAPSSPSSVTPQAPIDPSNQAAVTPAPIGDAALGAPATASQPGEIEDIVVTARRTEEAAQSVPVALVALSQKLLVQQAVLDVRDLQTSTPGLIIATNSQGGDPTFAIRGAKQDNGTSPTVAVYIDDVPVISTISVANMVYDMQSITTLKGPQGTLFGANSTGGAVIFRPNKPTDQLEGYVMAGYGNYNRREAQGMVNVPVSDLLQVRVAGEIVRRDGFETNISPLALPQSKKMSDDRHESVRVSARLNLSPELVNDTTFDFYHANQQPESQYTVYYRPRFDYQTFLGVTLPADYAMKGVHVLKPFQVATNGDPFYSKSRLFGIANTTTYNVNDHWTLKNVIGYRNDRTDNSQSQDAAGLFYSTSNGRVLNINKQWTIEPSSTVTWGDDRWSNKTGLFLLHSTQRIGISYYVLNEPFDFTGVAPATVAFIQSFYPLVSNVDETTTRKSAAIYDQLSFKASDVTTVTAGLRFTHDEASLRVTNRTSFPTTPLGAYGDIGYGPCDQSTAAYDNFDPVACTGTRQFKKNAVSYNLSIENKVGDRKLIYASFKGGYLVGGFNNPVPDRANQVFGPERVTEFEGGLKADWSLLDRPLRTNIAIFYGDYSGQQRSSSHLGATGTGYISVENAGSTRFYGVDLDLTYAVADFLTVSGSYNYLSAKYTNYNAALSVPFITAALDLAGVQESQAPKHVVTASATATLPVPSEYGKLSSTLSFYYRTKTFGHDAPTVGGSCADGSSVCIAPGSFVPNPALDFRKYDVLPGFGVFNLTVQWQGVMGTHVDAELFVKNLTNKLYFTNNLNEATSLGWASYSLGDPRTVGGRIRYNF